MTRTELASRIRNYFQNDIYYSGVDLNNSIQDGYDEVVAFSGCIIKSAVLTFTANTTYYDMLTLYPDYIGVIAIFNTVTKRWIIPTSLTKLDQDRFDWEACAGTPFYFVPINHRFIAIYKKPIAANYGNAYIYYVASAPTLVDGDQIQIPDDHISALEHYNRCDLLEQQQEFTKSSQMFKDYLSNLEELRAFVQNKRMPDRIPSLK